MTEAERATLKQAKAKFKNLTPEKAKQARNEVLYAMVKSPLPAWGSINIKV